MTFDIHPILTGANLLLRPMTAEDREALFLAASDPAIWAQHPATNRHERPIFDDYFEFLLGAGGTLVAIKRETEEVIGCSRFYPVSDQPGEWGIGFTFLSREHWGGVWNREMKALMVAHALNALPRVWFHIAPNNLRSQIATTRIGAKLAYAGDIDLNGQPSSNKCYTLTAEDWVEATGEALAMP